MGNTGIEWMCTSKLRQLLPKLPLKMHKSLLETALTLQARSALWARRREPNISLLNLTYNKKASLVFYHRPKYLAVGNRVNVILNHSRGEH